MKTPETYFGMSSSFIGSPRRLRSSLVVGQTRSQYQATSQMAGKTAMNTIRKIQFSRVNIIQHPAD
jgi:hypothetical protein